MGKKTAGITLVPLGTKYGNEACVLLFSILRTNGTLFLTSFTFYQDAVPNGTEINTLISSLILSLAFLKLMLFKSVMALSTLYL